jgi:hypothetical protein
MGKFLAVQSARSWRCRTKFFLFKLLPTNFLPNLTASLGHLIPLVCGLHVEPLHATALAAFKRVFVPRL